MRLFVAIDLPESVKELVAPLCHGLPGARWVNQHQLHLTLRFIGEVDGAMFREIGERLAGVAGAPFPLQLDGTGFFPPRGRPRVVWIGLTASEELVRLRNRIESALVDAGLEPEGRKFAPHITLARLKNTPASRVGRYLETHALFCSPPFTVRDFHLYSSQLGRNGAVHRREFTYALAKRL